MIFTMIQKYCVRTNDILWEQEYGSFPDKNHKYNFDTLRIHAVRGPITRNIWSSEFIVY